MPGEKDEFTWRNGAKLTEEMGELRGRVDELCSAVRFLQRGQAEIRESLADIKAHLGALRGKMAVWGALGGIIAGALVQIVIAAVVGR